MSVTLRLCHGKNNILSKPHYCVALEKMNNTIDISSIHGWSHYQGRECLCSLPLGYHLYCLTQAPVQGEPVSIQGVQHSGQHRLGGREVARTAGEAHLANSTLHIIGVNKQSKITFRDFSFDLENM